jgi:LysM repeat protein
LSSISVQTGIPLSTIEQLNPELDSQALQPGQHLRLRA